MRIDVSDQLFHDLSEAEARELCQWAEDVILRGVIAHPSPPWVGEWMELLGFDERQSLLVISTVLPARVFLSVLRYYRDDAVV